MLGHNPFYNESIRRIAASFGSVFNDITIVYRDENGNEVRRKKLPLSYGPAQKFLTRISQSSDDLEKTINRDLPRLSYRIVNIRYEPDRKLQSTIKQVKQDSNSSFSSRYMRIPVLVDMEFAVIGRTLEEMLLIFEQIAPFFAPGYNMSLDMIDGFDEDVDTPIVLTSTTITDDYEGDFGDFRIATFEFAFSVKTYIYGPATTSKIIRSVIIDFIDSDRQYLYETMTVTPRPSDMDPTDAPPITATGATGYDVSITLYEGLTGATG